MLNVKSRKLARYAGLVILLIAVTVAAGCVRNSGGTWYIQSAATPDGWPELTPVGVVEVKTYPTYRAAVVVESEVGRNGTESMFMELFRHIQSNDISMTAPVDMGYSDDGGMNTMAFLYRSTSLGELGDQGAVTVRDLEPRSFASVGVRGDYTDGNYLKGLTQLDAWLATNSDTWSPAGPARYLGYNGPFVPTFWRYGEVQVPVDPREPGTASSR